MQGEAEAIMRVPPAPATSVAPNAAKSGTITAAKAVGLTGASANRGVWLTLKPNVDMYAAFGDSATIAAYTPTSADEIFFGLQTEEVWCPPGCTDFAWVRVATDGTLKYRRSSL